VGRLAMLPALAIDLSILHSNPIMRRVHLEHFHK